MIARIVTSAPAPGATETDVAPPASPIVRDAPATERMSPRRVTRSRPYWLLGILLLAATVTASDMYFLSQLGLLANVPLSDGVAYMLRARQPAEMQAPSVADLGRCPLIFTERSIPISPLLTLPVAVMSAHAPLWDALLRLTYTVLGQGEWQSYTVRFWPTALLLGVVFVEVRRHSTTLIAWLATLVTAMLPTLSVGMRAAGYDYFVSGQVDFGREWFLADLRPDTSAAIMLTVSVAVILGWLRQPSTWRAVAVGVALGLTVLVKPTVSSITAVAVAALVVFGWLRYRHQLPPRKQFLIIAGAGCCSAGRGSWPVA